MKLDDGSMFGVAGAGAVHVVAQRDAVPVHRGRVVETVGHGDRQLVADVGADQRTGDAVVVGQRSGNGSAQVDVRRPQVSARR